MRTNYTITTTFRYSNGEMSTTSTTVNSRAAVAKMTAAIREWMAAHNRVVVSITSEAVK